MTLSSVLITGCSGFIGSALAFSLCEKGYLVLGLDILTPPSKLFRFSNFHFKNLDLCSSILDNLPPTIDFICHLAGQSSGEISFDSPCEDLNKNTISTLNLILYAIQAECKRFFYASSMSVYGDHGDMAISEGFSTNPLSCYGVSKLASENYLNVYSRNLLSTSFRMFNVYGPGQDLSNMRQGMVSIYLAQACNSSHIVVKGSKDRFRDFIYIDDVVDIWTHCIVNYTHCPSVLNVGTGIKTTVHDLLNEIIILFPAVTVEYLSSTPGDQFGIYADITALNSIVGSSRYTSIGDGLKKFSDIISL